MGRIQSQFGLITGTDILGTVDQLMAISGRPRDRLVARTEGLSAQTAALTELTVNVVGVELAASRLSNATAFRARSAESSDAETVTASAGSAVSEGRYTVRTLSLASSHRVGSKRFDNADDALGVDGTLRIRRGGFLDRGTDLADLNDGVGVQGGSFRITDRAGRSAVIEVEGTETVDDLIARINDAEVDVRVGTNAGRLTLADTSGATAGNLRLEQLGTSQTLADLGLHGVDVAADRYTGLKVSETVDAATTLSSLGGGAGVGFADGDDLVLNLSDGTTRSVDFGDLSIPAGPAGDPQGTTDAADVDAQLTITDDSSGASRDGFAVAFVEANILNGPGVTVDAGSQTITVRFGAGSTANDVATLINTSGEELSVTVVGSGTGGVSDTDTATLSRAPGTPAVDAPATPTLADVADYLNARHGDVVTASFVDGRLTLADVTGGGGAFSIEDASGSTTATDLGLTPAAVGTTVTSTLAGRPLRGVSVSEIAAGGTLSSLDIETSDGATTSVDLSSATSSAEIVDLINESGAAVLAGLNASGLGFSLRDVSGGSGTFAVTSADETVDRLGLNVAADGDRINGVAAGPGGVDRSTRLDTLGGGITQGSLTITDSAGVTSAVNLAVDGIETVGQLIDRINGLSIGVTAELSAEGTGVSVFDTASGTGTLTIADGGGDELATRLGLAGTATSVTTDGVTRQGIVGTDDLIIEIAADDSLADIVTRINDSGGDVDASLQYADDGRVSLGLSSTTAGAAGRFGVIDDGVNLGWRTNSTGRDGSIAVSLDGGVERVIRSADGVFEVPSDGESTTLGSDTTLDAFGAAAAEGSFTLTDSAGNRSAINLTVEGITTVGGLVDRINTLGIGLEASIDADAGTIRVVDTAGGGGPPSVVDVGGGAAAALGLTGDAVTETVGGVERPVLSSQSLAPEDGEGLTLTVKQLGSEPITIDVGSDTSSVTTSINGLVTQYNQMINKIDELTFFTEGGESVGLLFGSSETLRVQRTFADLISGRISGAGEFRSLGRVGLSLDSGGKLQLDEARLNEALENDPSAVEALFTTEGTGIADRLTEAADRIAGVENGSLIRRAETLRNQIDRNNLRVESLNERLENERERLTLQFYRTEEAIARIQSNQGALASIQYIGPDG